MLLTNRKNLPHAPRLLCNQSIIDGCDLLVPIYAPSLCIKNNQAAVTFLSHDIFVYCSSNGRKSNISIAEKAAGCRTFWCESRRTVYQVLPGSSSRECVALLTYLVAEYHSVVGAERRLSCKRTNFSGKNIENYAHARVERNSHAFGMAYVL